MLARARVGTSIAKSPGSGTVLIIPGRTREGLDSLVLPVQIFSSGCLKGHPIDPTKPIGHRVNRLHQLHRLTTLDIRKRQSAYCTRQADSFSPISPAAIEGDGTPLRTSEDECFWIA